MRRLFKKGPITGLSIVSVLLFARPVFAFVPVLTPGFKASPEAARFQIVCPGVHLQDRSDFAFTDMELRLICGDQQKDQIGVPWSNIPPNQATYFMRGFLQSRGHHQPEFIQDGDTLFVMPGAKSLLTEFRLRSGPEKWDPPKRRLIKGEPLTPALLNSLQGWALHQIKNEGYACAKVSSLADPMTGEAIVNLDSGEPKQITGIEDVGESGLRKGVLERYNAFRIGDVYRENLVSLTRTRTQEDGILQNLILTTRCEPDGVSILRDVSFGPSRTIRIGAGASTDEGARLRVVVRRNRIGPSASSAQARANLSYLNETTNRQVFDSSFRWYHSPGEARSYLEPQIIFEHASETAYETQSIEGKVLHGWNYEFATGQADLRMGPTYLQQNRQRGLGPGNSWVAFAEVNARWMTHDFEYWSTSPRNGIYLLASFLATQKQWGANFTAQKLQLSGQRLWEIFHFDPPLLVLGWRFDVTSVLSPDLGVTTDLPIRFLSFIGGEQDLRGFNRQSLPRGGGGALSGATTGLEARLHKVILKRADFFVFTDAGILGRANFEYRPPIFLSPGSGLRWESPVGVFRVYVASRFAIEEPIEDRGYDRQWRVGFTYGEEF